MCLIVGFSLLSSGCSIKFAYNNLDRFVLWGVSDYVDLTREQQTYLRREVNQALVWHRKNHLPMYAQYLQTFSQQASDEVTPAMLNGLFEQFFTWGGEVEQRALPVAVTMLKGLSDEQVAALPENFATSNHEIEEPELEGETGDHQYQWAQEFIDALQRFTGRLTQQQKSYIVQRAGAYQPERKLWAAYRRSVQAELMTYLTKREDVDFAAQFRRLVADKEQYYSPQYAQVSKQNRELGANIAAQVLSNLSQRQSQRFIERLQELSEDLAELAAEA